MAILEERAAQDDQEADEAKSNGEDVETVVEQPEEQVDVVIDNPTNRRAASPSLYRKKPPSGGFIVLHALHKRVCPGYHLSRHHEDVQ